MKAGLTTLQVRLSTLFDGFASPRHPAPEWCAVDLIQNHEMLGVALDDFGAGLKRAVSA